jgi:ribosomal protein L37AE/L43A
MINKYKPKKFTTSNKKVVISKPDDDSVKEYVCNSCRFIIHTRATEGEITCLHCDDIIVIEGTRKRSKLETPHKNIEPAITSVPFPNYKDVAIKKKADLQWGAKSLSQKGTIKFTSYEEK